MAVLDLRAIFFRAFEPEEGSDPPVEPPGDPVDGAINLSGIEFRAKEEGDA